MWIFIASQDENVNNLMESTVQTSKRGLQYTQCSSILEKLSKFLFAYLPLRFRFAPFKHLIEHRPRYLLDIIFTYVSKIDKLT